MDPEFYNRRILFTCLAVGAAAGILTFISPKTYESEVALLVDSGSQASGLLSALQGSDFPAVGSLDPFGGREAGNTYTEVVQSREVLTHLLGLPRPSRESETFFDHFAPRSGRAEKRLEKAVKGLRKSLSVDYVSRSGMLRIRVQTDNSVLSAEVANGLARELRRFDSEVRRSRARDAAEFVKERLVEARADLASAEADLARFRASNARIGNAPHLELEAKRLERRVRLNEETYALLTRESEMAKIQEKRENPVFSIVDSAVPTVRPAGLHPLIAAALASGIFAVIALFLLAASSARKGGLSGAGLRE